MDATLSWFEAPPCVASLTNFSNPNSPFHSFSKLTMRLRPPTHPASAAAASALLQEFAMGRRRQCRRRFLAQELGDSSADLAALRCPARCDVCAAAATLTTDPSGGGDRAAECAGAARVVLEALAGAASKGKKVTARQLVDDCRRLGKARAKAQALAKAQVGGGGNVLRSETGFVVGVDGCGSIFVVASALHLVKRDAVVTLPVREKARLGALGGCNSECWEHSWT
jgi:hypothetical protein